MTWSSEIHEKHQWKKNPNGHLTYSFKEVIFKIKVSKLINKIIFQEMKQKIEFKAKKNKYKKLRRCSLGYTSYPKTRFFKHWSFSSSFLLLLSPYRPSSLFFSFSLSFLFFILCLALVLACGELSKVRWGGIYRENGMRVILSFLWSSFILSLFVDHIVNLGGKVWFLDFQSPNQVFGLQLIDHVFFICYVSK